MNKLGKFTISLATSYLLLKIVTTKPIRNYLLGALIDTAYYVVKKKLK